MTISTSLYLSSLGFSPTYIGLVFLGDTIYTAALSMSLGVLGDRVGYRKVLIAADLVPAAALALLASTTEVYVVVAGVVLAGLGGTAGGARGAFSPGLTALVARNWEAEEERVDKMGKLTFASSLAGVGGGLLLSLHDYLPFGNLGDYRFLFGLSSSLLFTSALCLLKVKERPRTGGKKRGFMRSSSMRYVLKVIVSNSLSGIGVGLSIPILPLWFAYRFHASSALIGAFFSASGFSTALGSIAATRLRGEPLKVASVTRLLNGAILAAMAFSPFLYVAGVLYVIRGFNAGLGMPNRTAVNVRGVSEDDFGTASSLQGLATRLSQVSSGASGYLMEEGIYLPLELGGLAQGLGGILYYLLLRRRAESSETLDRSQK